MAAAPAATGANAAPTALARTYRNKYTNAVDVLGGDYSHLYDRVALGAATPQEAFNLAVNASDVIPKVYLCLTVYDNKPMIVAIHRPSAYQAHPVEAFVGEIPHNGCRSLEIGRHV